MSNNCFSYALLKMESGLGISSLGYEAEECVGS